MTNISISASSDASKPVLYKKAYNAFNNAKQRCNNEKNPSYPTYGKLGVKVLFTSFDQFIGHIGLPPNETAQLDRIDPSGNYEIGNVRWASPSVQAVNKKGNPLASVLSLTQQKSALLDMQQARARREVLTAAWNSVVEAINRGGFVATTVKHLASKKVKPGMFEAGWEPGQTKDLADPPSYFYMPSLTQLEGRIRLEAGPLPTNSGPHGGVILGLEYCAASGIDAIARPFFADEKGAVLIGGKSEGWLNLGGVEGIMMIAASRLKAGHRSVAYFPLMTAVAELRSLGSPYKWDELPAHILDCGLLFIPDFHIDYGEAVQPNHKEWTLLASLIDFRIEYGKRTYLGVQNINRVPPFVRDKLLVNFYLRQLPETPVGESLPDTIANGPKADTIGFAAVRAFLTEALYKP